MKLQIPVLGLSVNKRARVFKIVLIQSLALSTNESHFNDSHDNVHSWRLQLVNIKENVGCHFAAEVILVRAQLILPTQIKTILGRCSFRSFKARTGKN